MLLQELRVLGPALRALYRPGLCGPCYAIIMQHRILVQGLGPPPNKDGQPLCQGRRRPVWSSATRTFGGSLVT